MDFSIVIPTCNRNDLLSLCLDRVLSNTSRIDGCEFEVIVSDDSKVASAKSLIEERYSWATWVKGPELGPAANRNNGARHATGSWLIFTDDDCLPDVNWLETLLAGMAEKRAKVLEGKTIPDRPQKRYDEHSPTNINGDNLWSCNFAIERNLFWQVGGFDEDFPFAAMEDVDMNLKVRKIADVSFLRDAIVVHPWRLMPPFKNWKKWLVSHDRFMKKNGIKKDLSFRLVRAKILIRHCVLDFAQLVKFRFKGTWFFFEKLLFNFLMVF